MTRKKWNRLRRKYPQLFSKTPAWETMTPWGLALMRTVSVKEAYTRMHSLFISNFEEFRQPALYNSTWQLLVNLCSANIASLYPEAVTLKDHER